MNHPPDEEWLAYLDGEAPPQTARRLTQHLEQCPQCAAEVEGWRQSIDQLRRLNWPAAQPLAPVRGQSPALFQWTAAAAAAAVVLGLGFLLGRFSGPDPERLREALAADLKLRQEATAVRLSNDFEQAVHTFRAEHREAWLALAADLQRQQTADYLSLRKDLETVASLAEAGLRRADWRLTEIAATTQTDPNL